MLAHTPEPPYYTVIFTSVRTEVNEGYADTAARMVELAAGQPGFLGVESARNDVGITVSYWANLEAIRNWKHQAEHTLARHQGRKNWYQCFKTRICLVERDYSFERQPE
ncbi:antibiotic biosynthesis monooxygenase [Nibrella viscosa]|uniref:Antibiotic biosynthesis monooxygenase n=1 Tax=Nibrella viscosa TaxID=1084524 RepID=A0ABP8KJ12_9BACT